jgi:hypothetical protein
MERTPVISTTLASVGYDPAHQILEIEFHDHRVYQYSGVPQELFTGLLSADSHGRYFDTYIKKAGYPYQRIQ